MIEKLIIDFFNKIKKNELITSRNGKSVFFIEELLERKYEKINYISTQTANRLHRKYVEKEEDVPVRVPDFFLRNVMSKYLGFENFEEYKTSFSSPEINIDSTIPEIEQSPELKNITPSMEPLHTLKWYKKYANQLVIMTSIVFTLVFTIFIYQNNYSINGNCIIWKGDRFEKSTCFNLNSINNNKYSIDIQKFEKIKVVKDSTVFFKNGKSVTWWGQNEKGKIEYFTSMGIHPETKEYLKLVSRELLEKQGLLLYN